ncbi:MAG: hypothetical protein Q4B58_07600, partial [Bacteroidales bacterium]|nr:hypothetical protein [Bacteroidales bacterium]
EANNANITFAPDALPVSKGMVIAKSGNSGSSGGPHVHFELRDCNDDDDAFFDPMPLFLEKVADNKAPRIEQVYIYPLGGSVMGGFKRRQSGIVRQPNGSYNLAKPFSAWGRIGLGIKAYDHMDGQSNIYGVKHVKLFLGDSLIYSFDAHRFQYSERRFANALIDYDAWYQQRSIIMKSFVEPGNHLSMLDASLGDGTIVIDEERLYPFRYELTDAHGNKTVFAFSVKGVRNNQKAPEPSFKGYRYDPVQLFILDTLGCSIKMPKGK